MSDASSSTSDHFPAARPAVAWGPAAALVVTALAFVGAQVIAGVLLTLISGTTSLSDAWLTSTAGQFYFVLISDILIFLAILAFVHSRGAKLGSLGLARNPAWRDLGYALLGYAVYFGIFLVVVTLTAAFTQINIDQKQELGFDYLAGSTDKLMAVVSLVLLPPIVEEIVFRGFLFTGMRKKLHFTGAALITSAVFASLHLFGSSSGLLWIAGLDTLVMSLVLCYLREKTGALWAPMAVHCLKNAIAFTLLLSSIAVL